jgi:hypothetical protein
MPSHVTARGPALRFKPFTRPRIHGSRVSDARATAPPRAVTLIDRLERRLGALGYRLLDNRLEITREYSRGNELRRSYDLEGWAYWLREGVRLEALVCARQESVDALLESAHVWRVQLRLLALFGFGGVYRESAPRRTARALAAAHAEGIRVIGTQSLRIIIPNARRKELTFAARELWPAWREG